MENMRNAYRILIGIDGKKIFKWIGPVVYSCDCGDEYSGIILGGGGLLTS
jgi:hypothetical protein